MEAGGNDGGFTQVLEGCGVHIHLSVYRLGVYAWRSINVLEKYISS